MATVSMSSFHRSKGQIAEHHFESLFCFNSRQSKLQGSDKERTKYKQQLEVVGSEKQAVEKCRQNLLAEMSEHQKQSEKLKSSVAELQRQIGDMEDEKVKLFSV